MGIKFDKIYTSKRSNLKMYNTYLYNRKKQQKFLKKLEFYANAIFEKVDYIFFFFVFLDKRTTHMK